MFDLVFTRRFSMGHRLIAGCSEICATPHGHNEEVSVYLQPLEVKRLDGAENMVLPFHKAKSLWHRFIDHSVDHAFQLSEKDPLLHWFLQNEPQRIPHLLVTPGDPTTELLACLLMAKANTLLMAEQTGLLCHKIEIKETPTNTVSFTGDPLAFIPETGKAEKSWWQRADMSISDLMVTD